MLVADKVHCWQANMRAQAAPNRSLMFSHVSVILLLLLQCTSFMIQPQERLHVAFECLRPACASQVEEITQAVTPLLRTFFVGILQNPFAYEALQNFTTSQTTQGLLSGLRNATELGLPGLQRLLVRPPASCLLDMTSREAHMKVDLLQATRMRIVAFLHPCPIYRPVVQLMKAGNVSFMGCGPSSSQSR